MWMLLLTMAQATCERPTITFHGQPNCVALHFEDGKTHLQSECTEPLLVDQSMNLSSANPTSFISAGGHEEIRDLNAFTLGMSGKLYRVVATVEPCSSEAI